MGQTSGKSADGSSVTIREGTASNGEVNLYWVAEGDQGHPTVLLVNGAGSTSPLWSRQLVDPILAAGFQVVRFDNRDIGRSTWMPETKYTLQDMADDTAAVLDAAGATQAHIFGRSMGGMTAQWLAVTHPDRVRSLVLLYTSPGIVDERLPRSQPSVAAQSAAEAAAPATDEARSKIRHASNEFYAGSRYEFDREWSLAEAKAEVDHAPWNLPGHFAAVLRTPSLIDRLGEISAPTLVLHGDEDPIVPVEHGRFLAESIEGAIYHEFEGLSHELPPAFCDEITPTVIDFFSAQP